MICESAGNDAIWYFPWDAQGLIFR